MQLKAFKNQNIEKKTRMIQFGKNHVLITFFLLLLLIYSIFFGKNKK
jgi:hypothetical protein